jgi:hypothetical protein
MGKVVFIRLSFKRKGCIFLWEWISRPHQNIFIAFNFVKKTDRLKQLLEGALCDGGTACNIYEPSDRLIQQRKTWFAGFSGFT